MYKQFLKRKSAANHKLEWKLVGNIYRPTNIMISRIIINHIAEYIYGIAYQYGIQCKSVIDVIVESQNSVQSSDKELRNIKSIAQRLCITVREFY